MAFKPYAVRVAQGGSLITVPAIQNVGEANYREKVNVRRLTVDREALREGDEIFAPNPAFARLAQALNVPAGVNLIAQVTRPNGDKSIVAASKTTIYRYVFSTGTWGTVGSGYSGSGRRWQVEELNGWLCFNNTIDLPFTFRHEESATSPMFQLREIGIASVGTIAVSNGMLLLMDLTELQAAEKVAWMNGPTPYGIVPSNKTNRIQYKVLWSEIGLPREYAPIITGTMATAGRSVVLDFPSSVFAVGTKIAVVGAGPNGGVLGGQSGSDDGIPLATVSMDGLTLTWVAPYPASDAALTYPLTVQVARFADTSSIVGTYTIQDDSSRILCGRQLGRDRIAIYRETGIFTGRYTGNKAAPWVWSKIRPTRNVPAFEYAIANPTGEYHVYPSYGSFYTFDGSGDPQIHKEIELSKNLFYNGLNYTSNADDVFVFDNTLTKELFFCRPGSTFVYDYQFNKCSTINVQYTAAAWVTKPGTQMMVVLVARNNTVLRYGLDEAQAGADVGARIFYREDIVSAAIIVTGYTCYLLSGMTHAGDEFNEKILRSFVPQLMTDEQIIEAYISLFATEHPDKNVKQLFRRELLDVRQSLIPCFFQQTYFQDRIEIRTPDNTHFTGVDITGRIYEIDKVDSRAITKSSL